MGIKGINVILVEKIETGKDSFNEPVYKEIEKCIKNVLVDRKSTRLNSSH